MENKKQINEELNEELQNEEYIPPRNRKRKTEPKYPEFAELCKRRLREGNPITAVEINDMFKEAFKDIFEQMFKSELDEELGYSKYDYQNSTGENYRNGSYKKKLKSDFA